VADIHAGESNYSRARVPYGMDLAAAWSWRLLVVFAAGYVLARGIGMFAVLVLPVAIALLLTALVVPVVDLWSSGSGDPSGPGGGLLARARDVGADVGDLASSQRPEQGLG
jgi:hypothetical protein